MVEGLRHIVHELTKWGHGQIDMEHGNDVYLERELVQLYKLYFDLAEQGVKPTSFENLPTIKYANVRINLAYNFPYFGHYPVIAVQQADLYNPVFDTVDALDQLADIIAELSVVDWLCEQGREIDGVRYFSYAFERRIRARLLPLLNYLRVKVIPMAKAV